MILAILVSEMSKSEIFFSFPLHLSRVATISIPFERRHWSFYVYVCYENGPGIKREQLRPASVGIESAASGDSRVAGKPGGQQQTRVDYETRSVHFGYRLRPNVRCRQLCQLANSRRSVSTRYNPWTLDALELYDTWTGCALRIIYRSKFALLPVFDKYSVYAKIFIFQRIIYFLKLTIIGDGRNCRRAKKEMEKTEVILLECVCRNRLKLFNYNRRRARALYFSLRGVTLSRTAAFRKCATPRYPRFVTPIVTSLKRRL